jgi:hypothetical protein
MAFPVMMAKAETIAKQLYHDIIGIKTLVSMDDIGRITQ